MSSLVAIPQTTMSCSELGAPRSKASGSINDERMSSLLAIPQTTMPRSKLGAHGSRALDTSNDERMSSLLAIPQIKMPRPELGAHRSRASGSSNDERMSSLIRQHYLLRAFNNGNNSRESFVTPVSAKTFKSFSAPRDDNMLIYTFCVLGAGCILNSAVLHYLLDFFTTVLFVGYSPPQMYRQLVTMSRFRRCPLCLFVWRVRRKIFFPPG